MSAHVVCARNVTVPGDVPFTLLLTSRRSCYRSVGAGRGGRTIEISRSIFPHFWSRLHSFPFWYNRSPVVVVCCTLHPAAHSSPDAAARGQLVEGGFVGQDRSKTTTTAAAGWMNGMESSTIEISRSIFSMFVNSGPYAYQRLVLCDGMSGWADE